MQMMYVMLLLQQLCHAYWVMYRYPQVRTKDNHCLRFHMCEQFSSGTINPKQTTRQTITGAIVHVYHRMSGELLQVLLIYTRKVIWRKVLTKDN